MAKYATLKAAIQDVIKQNGNNEITGNVLQQALLTMINSLGAGFEYAGIATPTTNPGAPDQNLYYIAASAGTYTNFDGIVVGNGEIAILKFNGNWSKDSIPTQEIIGGVNDIYTLIPADGDGVGYYQNDLTIGNNDNYRYYLLDISQFAGKRIRLRAGNVTSKPYYLAYSCHIRLDNNTVIHLHQNQQYVIYKDNFVYVDVPAGAVELYLSWDKKGSGTRVTPMVAYEPLDEEIIKDNVAFTCGVLSNDNRYKNCILSFAFGVDNSAIEHNFALSMFGWNSQNSLFYMGVYDVTDSRQVGYTLFAIDAVPQKGIQHFKTLVSGISVDYDVEPFFDFVIDWSNYEQSMLFLNDNTKVGLSYRGKNEIGLIFDKTIKDGVSFDLFNNSYINKYYKNDLTLGDASYWQAKTFDVSNFRNKVLFFRCGDYSTGNFVRYCYFEFSDSYISGVFASVIYKAENGAYVLVPENAQTLYISFGQPSRKIDEPCLYYNESFNSLIYNYFTRGYITNNQKYQRCILGLSYDYSPTNVSGTSFLFSMLYFGINPDNMRFYIGFYDTINQKRIGYKVFEQVFESIPTSGIQLFEVDALSGHDDGAFVFTNVKIVIDWSKYEQSMWFTDGDTNPFIFLSTIGSAKTTTELYSKVNALQRFGDSFDILNGDYPVLPPQLFLQSDKSLPVYKNSLLTRQNQAYKIDINIIAESGVNFNRKIYEIKEPSYFGINDFAGTAKFFLQRVNDLQYLYYKNVSVFHKDVAAVSGKTIKVMSLGDSLTQGRNWYDTPVTMLAQDLEKYGVTLQYVGSLVRSYINNLGVSTQIRYEGRGAWRYRTFVGMESKFADLDVVIPSATQHEWIEGVDGDMNTIKANNAWLYPATAQDLNDNPDFCFHFVSGATVANKSYSEDATLGSYVIFDPVRYFSERQIEIPDIVTIALGTNEWYLGPGQYGGFNNAKATACAEFMIKQFRKVSPNLKIVVIPLNNFPVTRQSDWENYCMPLCANVIRVCDQLIASGDNKLYVCPIYAQGSRRLGFNGTIGNATPVSGINDMQKIEMDTNVHMLYERDDSNEDYRDSLLACILNLID